MSENERPTAWASYGGRAVDVVWRLANGDVPWNYPVLVGDELTLDVEVVEVAPLEEHSIEVVIRVVGVG